jgi:DNA-binding CsgD family transcriptional regulator
MSTVLEAGFRDTDLRESAELSEGATPEVLSLLFDEFSHAVVVATQYRKIVHANEAARREFARCDVLYADQGELRALSPIDGKLLQCALAKAASGERNLIRLSGSGMVLSVAVVPLKVCAESAATKIALFFGPSGLCNSGMFDLFARRHSLTPMEERVLVLLCRGLSAPEIAADLGVAVSTVRTHVRSLCVKTTASGTRELVTRVASLPPVGVPLHSCE